MISRKTLNLPNELLNLIFEFSYHAARELFTPYGKSSPGTLRWASPLDAPNLFPFNLASVCRLWRDILAQVPSYWTRLRFDVDKNLVLPTDAISWTRGQPFEVLVVGESSMDIVPITTALLLDLHHCDSIKYAVKYSSSLPHFTQLLALLDKGNAQLHSIRLDCKTEDSEEHSPALPRNINPPSLVNLYELRTLVLPCRMFLETCREYPCWYERLNSNCSLTLSKYRFHSPDPEDYTFQELLDYLGAMFRNLYSVHFRDLSLGYQSRHAQARMVGSLPQHVEMHNVDSALINMYFMTGSDPPCDVTFDGWSIPRFDAEAVMMCNSLWLQNIPDRYSLFNIFDAWDGIGGTVTIRSCPFFDDALLRWLGKPRVMGTDWEPMFCSGHLEELVIIDCSNFTVRALCQMLRNRVEANSHFDELIPLIGLRVSGQVPTPSELDAEWLKSHFGETLEWEVMGEDGEIKYDIKD